MQMLAGDFNQRLPRRSVPTPVHQALLDTLGDRFTVATTGPVAPIDEQTVDHIALTGGLHAASIRSISNLGPDGRKLSDHFGIAAELWTAGS